MTNKLGKSKETLPTLVALRRPQTAANTLVVTEARYLCKESSTFRVLIKPIFVMAFQVLTGVGLPEEGPPTFPVLIKLSSAGAFLTVHKYMFTAKGFPTRGALTIILLIQKGLSTSCVPVWLSYNMRNLWLEEA